MSPVHELDAETRSFDRGILTGTRLYTGSGALY